MPKEPTCHECGNPIPAPSKASFCDKACRNSYDNRRQLRGAKIYDLFMATRYDRLTAKDLGVWTYLCRMGEDFRDEDVREREGRPSWRDPKTVIDTNPHLKARVVGVVSKR